MGLRSDYIPVGGQAVIDGVMLRNGDVFSLAVRQESGAILAQRLPWKTIGNSPWLQAPFVRGFPIILESLINGVNALDRSIAMSEGAGQSGIEERNFWPSLALAFIIALVLFIIAPHMLSFLMRLADLGDDVEGLTFHLWDGFYKCFIFIAYIWLISFVPAIRRLFQYHGAEHKIVRAWEASEKVNQESAMRGSRLHPRCGTTFLLLVVSISIGVQACLLPFLFHFWQPQNFFIKHAASIALKLALVAPISSIAYEIIRFAASLRPGFLAFILQSPGLALQRLTTREPTPAEIDVALVALAEALGPDENGGIAAPSYNAIHNLAKN